MRWLPTLVVMTAAAAAHAGAWTKAPGHGYVKLGSASFVSTWSYDLLGEVTEGPFTLRAETLYAYAEVGVARNLTLVGYVPYVLASNTHTKGHLSFTTVGAGDASVGAQLGLLQDGPLIVSTRLDVKVPLYQGEPSVQGRTSVAVPGFPRSGLFFPALGDGQIDLTATLSAGTSLPFVDGFATGDLGYRVRTGPITDAVVTSGTAGVFLLDRRVLLLLDVGAVVSLPARELGRETVGKGYISGGPGFMYFLVDNLALEVGAQLTARGVNAAGGFTALVGVSYAF